MPHETKTNSVPVAAKRSRFRFLLFGLLLVGFAVVGYIALWLYNSGGLHFIQKVSGVVLPQGISQSSVYDSGDSFITAHVLIPQDSIGEFIARYNFSSPAYAHWILGADNLAPKFRQIPASADLALTGRSQNNRWDFVLDRTSGDLWMTVCYLDMAGDPP